MPQAPLRVCATCGVPGCQDHQKPAWTHPQPVRRIRGEKLQRLRKRLFEKQPLCALCLQQGRVTVATIRDHIVNLKDPSSPGDIESNVQGLCEACHTVKSEAEKKRGIQRS